MRGYMKNMHPKWVTNKQKLGSSSKPSMKKSHRRSMTPTAKCNITFHTHDGSKNTHASANIEKQRCCPKSKLDKYVYPEDLFM